MSLFVLDISHWQGPDVNLQTAKEAGCRAVYIKATEGINPNPDQHFLHNVAKAKAAGLQWGAYHFFKWAPQYDPLQQAQVFYRLLSGQTGLGQLRPAFDIELSPRETGVDSTERVAWRVHQLLTEFERLSGIKATIYTSFTQWERMVVWRNPKKLWARDWPSRAKEHPLWVADYEAFKTWKDNRGIEHTNAPRLPRGWTRWDLCQYSGSGTFPGFKTKVDLNRPNDDPDANGRDGLDRIKIG